MNNGKLVCMYCGKRILRLQDSYSLKAPKYVVIHTENPIKPGLTFLF